MINTFRCFRVFLVHEVNPVFPARKVNVVLSVRLVPKVLLANRVNVVCKVSWVLLVLLASLLNAEILDRPALSVKLALVV